MSPYDDPLDLECWQHHVEEVTKRGHPEPPLHECRHLWNNSAMRHGECRIEPDLVEWRMPPRGRNDVVRVVASQHGVER
jgi:hypothetical protein